MVQGEDIWVPNVLIVTQGEMNDYYSYVTLVYITNNLISSASFQDTMQNQWLCKKYA